MKKIGVYPGSFDPPTFGHIDIVQRASKIFDEVIIAVTNNPNKKPLFTTEERMEMLRECFSNSKNIKIETFKGLLVNYLKKKKTNIIIRGLRAISDFEYEFQLALTNRKLYKNVETVFLMPDEPYTYLSSSIVEEVGMLGGDIKYFVPKIVEKKMKEKFKRG